MQQPRQTGAAVVRGTLAQTSPVATGSMGMHQPTGTGAAVFGPHLHTHTSSQKLRILAGRSQAPAAPRRAPNGGGGAVWDTTTTS